MTATSLKIGWVKFSFDSSCSESLGGVLYCVYFHEFLDMICKFMAQCAYVTHLHIFLYLYLQQLAIYMPICFREICNIHWMCNLCLRGSKMVHVRVVEILPLWKISTIAWPGNAMRCTVPTYLDKSQWFINLVVLYLIYLCAIRTAKSSDNIKPIFVFLDLFCIKCA